MKRTSYIAAAVIAAAMTSCHHKDLYYGEPEAPAHATTVRVVFDWSGAPEADPAGMTAIFHTPDGAIAGMPHEFEGRDGGLVSRGEGEYLVLGRNTGTPSTLFDGTYDISAHRAYTSPAQLTAEGTPSGATAEPVAAQPDMLWGGTARAVIIGGRDNIVTIAPRQLTCIYTYEIRHVEHLERVGRLSAALTGMSGEVMVASGELSRGPVTLPAEATAAARAGDGLITGRLLTFGHHPEGTERHTMRLFAWMKDGRKLMLGLDDSRFDVTEQVHSAPDRLHVHIIIGNIDIDPDPGDDAYISISVTPEGWTVVRRDVELDM